MNPQFFIGIEPVERSQFNPLDPAEIDVDTRRQEKEEFLENEQRKREEREINEKLLGEIDRENRIRFNSIISMGETNFVDIHNIELFPNFFKLLYTFGMEENNLLQINVVKEFLEKNYYVDYNEGMKDDIQKYSEYFKELSNRSMNAALPGGDDEYIGDVRKTEISPGLFIMNIMETLKLCVANKNNAETFNMEMEEYLNEMSQPGLLGAGFRDKSKKAAQFLKNILKLEDEYSIDDFLDDFSETYDFDFKIGEKIFSIDAISDLYYTLRSFVDLLKQLILFYVYFQQETFSEEEEEEGDSLFFRILRNSLNNSSYKIYKYTNSTPDDQPQYDTTKIIEDEIIIDNIDILNTVNKNVEIILDRIKLVKQTLGEIIPVTIIESLISGPTTSEQVKKFEEKIRGGNFVPFGRDFGEALQKDFRKEGEEDDINDKIQSYIENLMDDLSPPLNYNLGRYPKINIFRVRRLDEPFTGAIEGVIGPNSHIMFFKDYKVSNSEDIINNSETNSNIFYNEAAIRKKVVESNKPIITPLDIDDDEERKAADELREEARQRVGVVRNRRTMIGTLAAFGAAAAASSMYRGRGGGNQGDELKKMAEERGEEEEDEE